MAKENGWFVGMLELQVSGHSAVCAIHFFKK